MADLQGLSTNRTGPCTLVFIAGVVHGDTTNERDCSDPWKVGFDPFAALELDTTLDDLGERKQEPADLRTPAAVATAVDRPPREPTPIAVTLNEGASGPPLFIIPGHGSRRLSTASWRTRWCHNPGSYPQPTGCTSDGPIGVQTPPSLAQLDRPASGQSA